MKIESLNDRELSNEVASRELHEGGPHDIATNQEYYDDIDNFYTKKFDKSMSERLLPMIKQGELLAENMSRNGRTYIQRSDSGNVTIKWMEDSDAIYLLGLISKKGRLTRGDVSSLNDWINRLLDALEDGKALLTSPNKYVSKAVLQSVVRAARARGFDLEIQKNSGWSLGDSPYLQWDNIIVRKQSSPRVESRPQLR